MALIHKGVVEAIDAATWTCAERVYDCTLGDGVDTDMNVASAALAWAQAAATLASARGKLFTPGSPMPR